MKTISKQARERLKQRLRTWILDIDRTDELPAEIVALNFNLYDLCEPDDDAYGIDLIGSTWFDEEDEDWACDQDDTFEPTERFGPSLGLPEETDWEEVLATVVAVIGELIEELPELKLFRQVEHIAVGFDDGDLEIIK